MNFLPKNTVLNAMEMHDFVQYLGWGKYEVAVEARIWFCKYKKGNMVGTAGTQWGRQISSQYLSLPHHTYM